MHQSSIEDMLGAQGRIASRLEGYVCHPSLMRMARAVEHAVCAREHLRVEAIEGMERTLAYLVPLIQRVSATGERVVISTHTPELRSQLLDRDIPLLAAVMPEECTAIEVLSRQHYISLRRMNFAMRHNAALLGSWLTSSEQLRMQRWSRTTTDGSLSDLSPIPGVTMWRWIRSEHGNCMGHRCAQYDACYYQTARRRTENAHILVVDHQLFFGDLALRCGGGGLLPDYDFAVLDETRQIPEVALSQFSLAISTSQVESVLDLLHDPLRNQGLLVALQPMIPADLTRNVCYVREIVSQQFCALQDHCCGALTDGGSCGFSLRVENILSPALRQLHIKLKRVAYGIEDEEILFELHNVSERCRDLAEQFEAILDQQLEGVAYRLEKGGDAGSVVFRAVPECISTFIQRSLLDRVHAVISTSTAFAENGESPMDDFCGCLGLSNVKTLQLSRQT